MTPPALAVTAPPPSATPEVDALDASLEPAALAAALGLPVELSAEIWRHALHGPARAFVARPGKRFRARLVEVAWRIAGGRGDPPTTFASVVELLHAGSLIIDDIEDAGAVRRGAPALHRLVGVPLALNTGNWLYCWPSQLVSQAGLPPAVELAVHRDLQQCLTRSHHGQALDLAVRVGTVRRAELPAVTAAISRLKTGALLALAARLGARGAGAAEAVVDALGELGLALGVGLQMLDDLGSLRAPAKAAEDLGLGRCTWPWAWLAEDADDTTWRHLIAVSRGLDATDPRAIAALASELGRHVGDRGRAAARRHLETALASLRAHACDASALEALAAEVARLETSYG